MQDQQLLRYGRHILLDDIGVEGQDKLLASRVLVVGAGGWARRFAFIWPVPVSVKSGWLMTTPSN